MFRLTQRFTKSLILATLLSMAGSGIAAEPDDQDGPGKVPHLFYGDVTLYNGYSNIGNTWHVGEAIGSSSDVDFLYMSCAGGDIKSVGMYFPDANADLDVRVYDLGGNYLGSSAGVSDMERVDISAHNEQVAIIEVYGYRGAVGPYSPHVICK